MKYKKRLSLQFFGGRRRVSGGGRLRKWVFLGLAAVILLAAVLLVRGLLSGDTSAAGRTVQPVIMDDGTLYFLTGGTLIDSHLDATQVDDWAVSMDGEVACFRLNEGNSTVVYLLHGKDVYWVAQDPRQVMLSQSGQTLAYLLDGELYLYDLDKKTAQKQLEDVAAITALSPDGRTVAYTDSAGLSHLLVSGKQTELGSGLQILSVCNGGKYAYVLEGDSLYLYSQKGREGLVSAGVDLSAPIYTNETHDQLIFRAAAKSGQRWYAVGKRELEENRHDLSTAEVLEPVLAQGTPCVENPRLTALGCKSLTGLLYCGTQIGQDGGRLMYVGKDWATSTLVSNAQDVALSTDGTLVFYRKGDRVFCAEAKAGAQSDQIAQDAAKLIIAPDGKGVYYLDAAGTLYYCKRGAEAVSLLDKVQQLDVTHDGYALAQTADGLYACKRSGQTTQLATQADRVQVLANGTYYCADSLLYGAAKGIKMKELGVPALFPLTDASTAE